MRNLIAEKSKLKIPLFVVYRHPSDFPDHFVARLWELNQPTGVYELAETLKELQAKLPVEGMLWIKRQPSDDPVILGTWV